MAFTLIENKQIGEKVYYMKHKTGLKIYVSVKPGFAAKYAVYGTRYGSIDNRFRLTGDRAYTEVPEGIAHFLEHKLFESDQGDAFARYAKTGANANAYTSSDCTCYLFSCTERFEQSLEILLDFVNHPYFTEQTVQKEQGIIGQEINMYLDDPDWRVYFNLLGAFYHNHPVKYDIAGSVESISHITAELLYRCYQVFYNPGNMVLCVCGDVDPQTVADYADRLVKPAEIEGFESVMPEEPAFVAKDYVEQALDVSVPLFRFGYKDDVYAGREQARHSACMDVLTELIFGSGSPAYKQLYESGAIGDSFESEYMAGRGYAAVIAGGVSRQPKQVVEAFEQSIQSLKQNGIAQEDFDRVKKALYGRSVSRFDNVTAVAGDMIHAALAGLAPFELLEALTQLTLTQAQQALERVFVPERRALSVIVPV